MALSKANKAVFLNCELKVGIRAGQDSAPSYFHDPVNFTSIEITPPVQESIERLSNMTSNYGSALSTVPKPTEAAKVKLTFNDFPPQLLAVVLGADLSEVTQTTAAVPDEAVTPVLGAWVRLANKYIAPHGTGTEIVAETSGDSTIAHGSGASVTNGVFTTEHYAVDLVNGMFKAITSTGATVAKISYHKAAKTVERYEAGQAKSAYLQMSGTATEKISNANGSLDLWCASVSPSGALELMAGDYFAGVLEGTLVVPAGQSTPWRWEVAA